MNDPSFKLQWKKALFDAGYINRKPLKEDIDFFYDGRGWILPDGKIISTCNGPHSDSRHDSERQCDDVRYNFGLERYISLPSDRPTEKQLKSLLELLDNYFVGSRDAGERQAELEISYRASKNFRAVKVSPFEYSPDDVIRLIKRMYATGITEAIGHVRFLDTCIEKQSLSEAKKNKALNNIKDEAKRVQDVIKELSGIQYGFVSKISGEKVTDRDWIHDCKNLYKHYDVQYDPEVTLNMKLGICQDQAIATKYLMNKLHPEDLVKLYALTKEPKGHCIACYCHDEKWYWIEHS